MPWTNKKSTPPATSRPSPAKISRSGLSFILRFFRFLGTFLLISGNFSILEGLFLEKPASFLWAAPDPAEDDFEDDPLEDDIEEDLPLANPRKEARQNLNRQLINESAEAALQPNADYFTLRSQLMGELNRFNKILIDKKKIWADKDLSGAREGRGTPNEIRLWIKNKRRQPQQSAFRGNVPALFRLHTTLALCNQNLDQPRQALAHLRTALQYRPYSATEQAYQDEGWYQYRPQDAEGRQQWQEFRDLTQREEELAETVEKLDRQQSVERSNQALGRPNQLATITNQLNTARQELEQVRQALEARRQSDVAQWQLKKQATDASILFRVAGLVKEIEEENKKKLRIRNQNNFGTAVINDYSKSKDFFGYAALVEFAARLDPRNPLYPEKLSDEYARRRDQRKAIYYTRRAIRLWKEQDPAANSEKITQFHFRAGGLMTNVRDYLGATYHFEKFLELSLQPAQAPQREQAHYYLADLHFRRTGHLDQARKYYNLWLQSANQKDPNSLDTPQRFNLYHRRFQACLNLSDIARKQRRPTREAALLNQSLANYDQMKQEVEDIRGELREAKREVLAEKKRLMTDTRENSRNLYVRAVQRHDQVEHAFQIARSKLAALRVARPRQALAAILEERHDYRGALEQYDLLISAGINVNRNLRRRQRIERILRDGYRLREN